MKKAKADKTRFEVKKEHTCQVCGITSFDGVEIKETESGEILCEDCFKLAEIEEAKEQ